jgi:hypothetical protein
VLRENRIERPVLVLPIPGSEPASELPALLEAKKANGLLGCNILLIQVVDYVPSP